MKPYKESILIVDDSYDLLEVLQRQLQANGYHTYQASNVVDAIDVLKGSHVDLLITDMQMPGIHGLQLVKYAAEHFPKIPRLVITGFPSVSGAIEAVKSGAVDYLVKPFTQGELLQAVDTVLHTRRITKQANPKMSGTVSSYAGIIGVSDAFQKLIEVIGRVKDNRATVLVQGESGTGKELVARAIHYSGSFSKAPFIAVNCGAIPENLLESELFGFLKGSFTGANETRAGFFQAADGGTIFLDEIGNASSAVQSRLLRVLQEKEITMIGAVRPQKINVRVIAATNVDLYGMVQNGTFREDLYYRLNVVNLRIPPLRERMEDIPILARAFIQKFSREFQRDGITITEKAMELLMRHSWPGNIRELENVIQRAIIMCDGEIL